MSDQDDECNCPPEGLPAYMGTFADLMALLMCFFVLLLAFSEMDVLKFKQLAGSMKFAFGVQNKLDVKDIPKGTSVIAQEFSPGKPTPTMIESIMQHTIDTTKQTLEFDEPVEKETDEGDGSKQERGKGENTNIGAGETTASDAEDSASSGGKGSAEELSEDAEQLARSIAAQMSAELESGQVELLAQGTIVVIRIRESGSFSSGSDRIRGGFIPVIRKIGDILKETSGEVRVAGHTDDIPIDTDRFRSNWELSGGRAGSVVRELLVDPELSRDRFVITGYADTRPIADNSSSDGRAKNRRVEIVIVQGNNTPSQVIGVSSEEANEANE